MTAAPPLRDQIAALNFAHNLYGHPSDELFAWLQLRDVDTATADQWGLGHAPAANVLATEIPRPLVPAALHVGLLGRSRRRPGQLYDRLNQRVTIPMTDRAGRLVAMTGRDLTGQRDAKYLITRSDGWDRNTFLFGHRHAMRTGPPGPKRRVYVVEGQMDAIRLCRVGLPAVAVGGSALSADQAIQAADIGRRLVIVLDGDKAGRTAAIKAARACLENKLRATVLLIEDSDGDPDDLVRYQGRNVLERMVRERGVSAWSALIDAEMSVWTGWKRNPSVPDLVELGRSVRPYIQTAYQLDPVDVEHSMVRLWERLQRSIHFQGYSRISVDQVRRSVWHEERRRPPARRRKAPKRQFAAMEQEG